MKIYNISNIEGLCRTLDSCGSDVVLTTEDGCEYSWREQSGLFRSMARGLWTELPEIGIRAARADSQRIMDYMMAARRRTA